MPEITSNTYLTKCGMTKYISSDREKSLKVWYGLHQKRCDICKSIPYKFSGQYDIETNSVQGQSEFDKKISDPMYGKTMIEKLLKLDTAKAEVLTGNVKLESARTEVLKRIASLQSQKTEE